MHSVAFFDFDKTLVDCNSANDWFLNELRAGRIPLNYAIQLPLWTLQYRLGYGDVEHMFDNAFMMARGQEEQPMIEHVREWFDTQIRPRVRPGALLALREHRNAGDMLVVATSSSQYVGQLACQAFGLDDYISTRLELENGRFTGRVTANAMGPAKAKLVEAWTLLHNVDLAACTFYSDSITDLALLRRVGHPVVVNPDRRLLRAARESGWQIVDWGRAQVR